MRPPRIRWTLSALTLTAVACSTAVEPTLPQPPQCLYGTPSGVVLLMDCDRRYYEHLKEPSDEDDVPPRARLTRKGELTQSTPSTGYDTVEELKAALAAHPPRVQAGRSRLAIVAVIGKVEVTTSVVVQDLDWSTLAKHGIVAGEKI